MNAPIPSKPEQDQGSDESLASLARAGDAAAFDALVVRYQDRVFNMSLRMLGNREDALDVSQEIFLTVFKSLKGFAERSRFGTWLYRITVNRCRDELRRRGSVKHTRPQSLDIEQGQEPSGREPTPAQQASVHELEALVEAAIAKLPQEAREALVLRDQEDLSYEQIAAVLEVPVGTVRSRLNRARTLVQERLAPILEVDS